MLQEERKYNFIIYALSKYIHIYIYIKRDTTRADETSLRVGFMFNLIITRHDKPNLNMIYFINE
jgi:hypothetical protein